MKEEAHNKYQIMQPLWLALMVILGMLVGYRLNQAGSDPAIQWFDKDRDVRLGRVEEVLRHLDARYLYDPDEQAITDEMLAHLFSRLDPYSLYIPPDELDGVLDRMNGNYRGIGIETIIMEDTIVVTRVLPGSPAEQSGIQLLDRILAVDDRNYSASELDFESFRKHVIEAEDSTRVRIFRKKTGLELVLPVKAAQVENASVRYAFHLEDSIYYIRIEQFVNHTYREFMEAMEAGQKDNRIPALIIDVRDNPGGFLGEVTKILSQFFNESEKLLVRTEVRDGKEKEYLTTGRNFYDTGKIVVLVNEQSASGSEVLAGSLQDWDRALVVGRPTYGKGLVQEQFELSSGGAIRITVADYYLPSGRSIQHSFPIDTGLFEKDPDYDENADSNQYYSLLKKRPLLGSGGITPDTLVKELLFDRVIWPTMFRDARLDEIVIKHLESQRGYNITAEKDVSDALMAEAGNWILQKENLGLENDELDILLKAKMIQFSSGDQEAVRWLLDNDPAIRVTLKMIR